MLTVSYPRVTCWRALVRRETRTILDLYLDDDPISDADFQFILEGLYPRRRVTPSVRDILDEALRLLRDAAAW